MDLRGECNSVFFGADHSDNHLVESCIDHLRHCLIGSTVECDGECARIICVFACGRNNTERGSAYAVNYFYPHRYDTLHDGYEVCINHRHQRRNRL